MRESSRFPDAAAREAAVTTFDRNVVVLAGAGTGKTTLLVNRLLHALLREPQPIRLVNMLALTFTNKAAQEMKLRLREGLQALLAECQGVNLGGSQSRGSLREFQERYVLSTETIRSRVELAISDLERSHIRTLHSFAASVLRLYPLEAEVSPTFQEDTGTRFDELFEQMWEPWLEQELGPSGLAYDRWESVLQLIPVQEIRSLGYMIAREDCALTELQPPGPESETPQQAAFRQWLMRKVERGQGLLQVYRRPKPRKIERNLEEACRVFEQVLRVGTPDGMGLTDQGEDDWDAEVGVAPRDWDLTDFHLAKQIIQTARQVRKINHSLLERLLRLLAPFIERVRQRYREQGWIGFDGLLLNVRNLLRDHPIVREQMKQEYQAILIDEFQDTDPLQYEILLYLAECSGQHARSWSDIRVVPGKLFIVGDPKQSIYAFRRADMAAFDQVVKVLVEAGALVCPLTTNFRSHENILKFVNAVFEQLLIQKDHVQPPHVPLEIGRETGSGAEPGVELFVLAQPEGEQEWDTERATRAEAEWLGEWVQKLLNPEWAGDMQPPMKLPVRPGDIAVLFRKLTNAQWYVEALRRRGIPYVIDGERHFYQRQEVIDLVNVLRLIDDPADSIALVGVLRSSLGGVPDSEIMALAESGPLDMSHPTWLDGWQSERRGSVHALCARLVALHHLSKHYAISPLFDRLFEDLPVTELAAASSHAEQAVVNLWKLRDLMIGMSRDSVLSFSDCVDRLVRYLRTPPQEAEAPLAEDTVDAVRVLTIHKAKGLEFPVVVLPGLHVRAGGNDRGASLTRDWISGMYGVTFARWCNASQVPLWEKHREQEEAEQRRILYVGMTRAKERLVLSGGVFSRSGGGTPFHLLRELLGNDFGNPACSSVQVGNGSVPQRVVISTFRGGKAQAKRLEEVPEAAVWWRQTSQWKSREDRWAHAREIDAWVTPSTWKRQDVSHVSVWKGAKELRARAQGSHLGTLVHRFLEYCHFPQDEANFQRSLDDFCLNQKYESATGSSGVLLEEMQALLADFPNTRIYQELRQGRIIGREVPVTVPWEIQGIGGGGPERGVLEGVLDLVYEINGEYWIGDYKTDVIDESQLAQRIERYRGQAELYTQAVARSLGLNLKGCKIFFLRLDRVEEVLLVSERQTWKDIKTGG